VNWNIFWLCSERGKLIRDRGGRNSGRCIKPTVRCVGFLHGSYSRPKQYSLTRVFGKRVYIALGIMFYGKLQANIWHCKRSLVQVCDRFIS
jgi:hypothetical protein